MNKLILASTSSYRKALLERLFFPFSQVAPTVDEELEKKRVSDPQVLASTLATLKARSVLEKHPHALVIGGDQVAYLPDESLFLDKPETHEGATKQLRLMSGKVHHLYTAIALLSKESSELIVDIARLKMRELSDEEIENYLIWDRPYDCAGSYKIEEKGISLFESIQVEDFTSIVGIPLIKLNQALLSFHL